MILSQKRRNNMKLKEFITEETNIDNFVSEIDKYKAKWLDIVNKFQIDTNLKKLLNDFFMITTLEYKKVIGSELHKKITENIYQAPILIIISSILNYKYIGHQLINKDVIFSCLDFIILDIIKSNLNMSEITELFLGLSLILQEIFPDETREINSNFRKLIRKKIPDDLVSDKLIDNALKIKENIMKTDNFGINVNYNKRFLELLNKVYSYINEYIETIENNKKKEDKNVNEKIENIKLFYFSEEAVKGTPAYKAKYKVNNAIKSGKIKKPSQCSKCHKKTSRLEFSHNSYKNPLKGKWLCHSCHRKLNKKLAKKRGPEAVYNPSGKYPKKT
jgi:hypothetical protein